MANILIVDDSRTSRRILRGILESAGHVIVGEAVNGEDGFIQYKELHPDIVTMDITMPKMDGIEALELIKHENSAAVVIMITAAGQQNKVVEAIRAGAREFLTKPFDDEEIIKAVNEVAQGLGTENQ
ncbi:MAG: response regulator [Eubacteriales bacterium]|nr:response regulator [Eubacteriales bacterium]